MKYNRFFLFFTSTILSLFIFSCKENCFSGYLYPMQKDGLWGYIDSVGNEIIAPEFLYAGEFHNGLALVVVDTLYITKIDSLSYMDVESDTTLHKKKFICLKYGYIEKNGRFRIRPNFVTWKKTDQRIINMNDLKYFLSNHNFSNDRAAFRDSMSWRLGYIDSKGKIVVKPKYYIAKKFNEGKAVVALQTPAQYSHKGLMYGYINRKGKEITEIKYQYATSFGNNRAVVYLKENLSNDLLSK